MSEQSQTSGGGFIPTETLQQITLAWQLRAKSSKDVDMLEKLGGNSGHKNRHELHLQRAQDTS